MMDITSGELQVPPQSIFCLLDNRWCNLSLYSTSFSVQVTEMERSHPSPGGSMIGRGTHTASQQAAGGIPGGSPHLLPAGAATCGCVAGRTTHPWEGASGHALGNKLFPGSWTASLTNSHPSPGGISYRTSNNSSPSSSFNTVLC